MRVVGYQVSCSCWGNDISYLDSESEIFSSLTDAVSQAEASWIAGNFEKITVIDWRPLAAGKWPEIHWLRHRSSRNQWKKIFDNGREMLLVPSLSSHDTNYFGFHPAASEFRVVKPRTVVAEGPIAPNDTLKTVLEKIGAHAFELNRLVGVTANIYVHGFSVENHIAKFVLSDDLPQ